MTFRVLLVLTLLLTALGAPLHAQDHAKYEADFRVWLDRKVWPKARSQGVSRPHFGVALSEVTIDWDLPGIDLPDKKKGHGQTEFASPGKYFRRSTIEGIERIGRRMAARYATTLARVERDTGVPGHVILAIWGRESGFGHVGNAYNAFEVLATRAFFGPNEKYFTGELIAALTIAGHGNTLQSSWAGALGQPQMMPTSYLAYGADGDGDGQIDIWRSEPDTIASIGKFLADHDWVRGRDWGFEVKLPDAVSCALEGTEHGRPIRDWAAMGVARISGRPFPDHEVDQIGFLLTPAGRNGPAFIVTPNFHVLKNYNRSDLYALFVGNMGDRIKFGMGDFRASWPRIDGLTRSDVANMQRALERLGHDTGGADGIAGFRTRRSIGTWQEARGEPATCFPDKKLKTALN